jgi:hypothetical protein
MEDDSVSKDMTMVYIVGYPHEASQSYIHGTWLLPQVFSTGTRLPHGVCSGPSFTLGSPAPVENIQCAAFSIRTRAGRNHSTGSVDPSLITPVENRQA